MGAATIASVGRGHYLEAVRRMVAGEKIDQASSGLTAREWREVAGALGLQG